MRATVRARVQAHASRRAWPNQGPAAARDPTKDVSRVEPAFDELSPENHATENQPGSILGQNFPFPANWSPFQV